MNITLGTIEVLVDDGRWNAFGDLTDPGTKYAYDVLTAIGGINESVTPGAWDFTVIQMEDGTVMVTLYPSV